MRIITKRRIKKLGKIIAIGFVSIGAPLPVAIGGIVIVGMTLHPSGGLASLPLLSVVLFPWLFSSALIFDGLYFDCKKMINPITTFANKIWERIPE